jgi:BioD-like phosphotransacetylase family protein
VGSVIDLSNAQVARMLGAQALIVSEAGVGRPIDEIVLNRALFEREGVRVVGAVVNKVDQEAHPSLAAVLERGLAHHGIELLGVLPYRPLLSNPTLAMLVEQVEGEVLHPGPDLGRVIDHVAVGAMQPGHVLDWVGRGGLLIVPGDREDVLQATVTETLVGRAMGESSSSDTHEASRTALAGLVLTAGYRPSGRVLEAIRHADLFTYAVATDTYAAASRVHDLLVKTHPADLEKIELIKSVVREHLDADRILERFAAPVG